MAANLFIVAILLQLFRLNLRHSLDFYHQKNVWISNFCSSCEKKKLGGDRSLSFPIIYYAESVLIANLSTAILEMKHKNSKQLIGWKQTQKCCRQTFSCLVTPEMALPRVNFTVEWAAKQLDWRRVLFTHSKKSSASVINSSSLKNNLLFIIFKNSIEDDWRRLF